ncbi:hypothetical protein [Flavobacterium cyanobacteriorum]|nr:hypothetical protein [Flavobacterium cyanobacteriorum]
MTAVVGILNKQAIALAADSAVTIGAANGNKIFNRANKLFTLSKHHPIGIMVYNSATFITTPWEIIIKMYRKQLSTTSFPKVEDYKDDFLRYLQSKDYFADEETQKLFLSWYFKNTIDKLINEVLVGQNHLIQNPTEENRQTLIELIDQKTTEFIPILESGEICPNYLTLTYPDYLIYANPIIDPLIQSSFTDNMLVLSADLINKIKLLLYHALRLKETATNYTGLIFVGYGEEEIYPKLLPINIFFVNPVLNKI